MTVRLTLRRSYAGACAAFVRLDARGLAGALSDHVGKRSRFSWVAFSCGKPMSSFREKALGFHQQIIDPDAEATDADARRMPDRIGHGSGRAGDADLADALDAEHVHMRIDLVDGERLHVRDVGIHRHMVFA